MPDSIPEPSGRPDPEPRTASREPRILNFRYSALLHPPVFADDHRRDGLAALDRRDVEALDAARHGRQRQHGAQRFERVVVRGDVLVEARLVGDLGVARREVEQPALLAALRHDEAHAAPGLRRQPALEQLGVGVAEARPAGGSPAAPVRSA